MYKTEYGKISLIISKQPLVVVFFEYPNSSRHKNSQALAFNLTRPYDICQLQQLANITGTSYGNFLDLDQKHVRLIINEDSKFVIKAIGASKRDQFFMTDGNGTLLSEDAIYQNLANS